MMSLERAAMAATLIFAMIVVMVEPASAQGFGGANSVLQQVQTALVGPLGVTLAVLAVIGVGLMWMYGQLDWMRAGMVLVGIAIVFGAPQIVQTLKGAAGG